MRYCTLVQNKTVGERFSQFRTLTFKQINFTLGVSMLDGICMGSYSKILLGRLKAVCIIFICLAITGCGAKTHYSKVQKGVLSGDIVLKWAKPDLFEFVPDKDNPLTFTRNGESIPIQPGVMFTDGGSIPRPMRAFKNYSPWGYAPAFIIHDWLFVMQHCKIDGWDQYTLDSSAMIMSEVMKTMMESPEFDFGDEQTLYLMYLAVKTPIAKKWWEDGKCKEREDLADDIVWDIEYKISFDQ